MLVLSEQFIPMLSPGTTEYPCNDIFNGTLPKLVMFAVILFDATFDSTLPKLSPSEIFMAYNASITVLMLEDAKAD
jgi:hypothetical protein